MLLYCCNENRHELLYFPGNSFTPFHSVQPSGAVSPTSPHYMFRGLHFHGSPLLGPHEVHHEAHHEAGYHLGINPDLFPRF